MITHFSKYIEQLPKKELAIQRLLTSSLARQLASAGAQVHHPTSRSRRLRKAVTDSEGASDSDNESSGSLKNFVVPDDDEMEYEEDTHGLPDDGDDDTAEGADETASPSEDGVVEDYVGERMVGRLRLARMKKKNAFELVVRYHVKKEACGVVEEWGLTAAARHRLDNISESSGFSITSSTWMGRS
ncbi:hypothetical protein EJ06DRAFT_173588 [Trichodelitschia bisporula]|uniref:Uncharacterized protein n=1 Tax=Trichodelitschia bisporula TaxID=703511 RepID=A0A6G1HLW2_9PEZI|nr:hypothetical protein EJ06DRAFT_173588 [Trichodelitschia bisporula]